MALNPSKMGESLNSPLERANQINDPQFENQQGYFPYDLTHQEILTPRFGELTPCLHMITAPGDRIVMHDNTKLIRNQITGNLLSQINQYVDSFYVAKRALFPNNYEKLITNPTKGDDLPNSALPIVPFNLFVSQYLNTTDSFIYAAGSLDSTSRFNLNESLTTSQEDYYKNVVLLGRMALLATVLSRGQLLDYLGFQFDWRTRETDVDTGSELQKKIDAFFANYYDIFVENSDYIESYSLTLTDDALYFGGSDRKFHSFNSLSEWRGALSDIFEAGRFPVFGTSVTVTQNMVDAYSDLYDFIATIFTTNGDYAYDSYVSDIDSQSNPFQLDHIDISSALAYQLIVAQYCTNNTVDNIFNSDLYMQLLRSVMYPSIDGFTSEPTFDYNGVATEYDYISAGGFYHSLCASDKSGIFNRQYVWLTLMLLMRRSLRYGDYFSTARPNMLAVGQLSINVEDGAVSPIDVTRNLLMQRYLNAANYIGSGFLQYFASIYGVTPSDTGIIPRYIAHRTITLQNRVVDNTAENLGAQNTNLVGYSDNNGFDVFIDDHGIILNLTSFDVLPVYTSGIDAEHFLKDRFDLFNPMLQNIGDQPIYLSELYGDPGLHDSIFGYTMRNSEYKFKVSRAHGAFCNNDLAGFLVKYPFNILSDKILNDTLHINPDFIRDKPMYLDDVLNQQTGYSPAQYWHFIVSCTNQVKAARKIQATPPVLF